MTETKEQVQSQLTNEEVVKQYLDDPAVKQNCLDKANQIYNGVSKNWFDLNKLMKKTIFKDPTEAYGILQLLCILDLCVSKNEGTKIQYKITLTDAAKLKHLIEQREEMVNSHAVRLNALDAAIARLQESA